MIVYTVFLSTACEAQHWDWTLPIEGLQPFTHELKGRLTKKAELLWVAKHDVDCHLIYSTSADAELAKRRGVEIKAPG
jgi:hypothetical protein